MAKINMWDDVTGNRLATLALTNNLSATTDPGVSNDSSQGYESGSEWINTSANRVWTCISAAAGAAVWARASNSVVTGANGLSAAPLALMNFRNTDGSTLAAAAAAGKFGQSITLGTTQHLVSEAANNNTKTDDAIIEYVLPPSFVAGKNLTVTVNASITGAGTLSTKTAQIKAYRTANDGTQGADIGPGAGVAITAAGADIAFLVTGATLNPGDKLVLELETVLTETASSNMVANINSVRVS